MKSLLGSELFNAIVAAPFGAIGVRTSAGQVQELVYLPPHFGEKDALDPVAAETVRQLERYLADPAAPFDLPLAEVGTPFQRRVWKAIAAIPHGSVQTYGQVGKLINCGSPRAVGQACGANWYPLIIPCHRVTASGGLGGFSNHDDENGFHLSVKRWLLAHEGAKGAPWQQQTIWS